MTTNKTLFDQFVAAAEVVESDLDIPEFLSCVVAYALFVPLGTEPGGA